MADEPYIKAEQAVADAIVKRAKGGKGAENTPSAEELKHLGEAVGAMKWGPQGGEKIGETTHNNTTHYHYDGDVHNTSHEGEKRDRPSAGFGDGGAS